MSKEQENNMSEEEYLRRHLEGLEQNKPTMEAPVAPKTPLNNIDQSRTSDLHYFAFDVREFPCGLLYPPGSTIQVRAAQVKEIQAYSMVDDNNFYDIVEKMNDMLSSCVRIKHLDGTIGSYLDLRDPDRYYLIFLIRELTFQKGSVLTTKVNCSCGNEVAIELKRENFKFFQPAERVMEFFDPASVSFRFQIKTGQVFNLAPPTIGVQKSFTDYIVKENAEKRKPNLSFLKIIPFMLPDRNSITIEGIKSKLDEFQKMEDIPFQFLNSAVEKLTFGIEKLQSQCQCGLEIHTDMIFPDGPSAVFVVHDAFEQFIKE